MEDFYIEIDFNIATSIWPEETIQLLKYLQVAYILDFEMFKTKMGYEPSVGSLFVFGLGGSYDFDDTTYGTIDVRNGMLQTVGNFPLEDYSYMYYDLIRKN